MEKINNSKKEHKNVSFMNSVIEPKTVVKCMTCGHRNISPRIREIFLYAM
jgi:hypothetical protein